MANLVFDDIFTSYYTQYRAEATVPVGAGLASTSWDDEYTIAMRLANEAINRWAQYDGTYWKDLFTTLQTDGGGDQTIVTNQTTYKAPTNFQESGGFVRVKNATGTTNSTYQILDPQDVQFKDDNSTYAYFTQGKLYYSTGTASQSATTVTGVGTTWTSAMVGMQIQFVTGETATITAFGSTTSLTVSPSQTVASGTYKIVNPGYTLNLNPAPTSALNGLDIDYVYYKKPTLFTTGTSFTEMSDPYFIVHRILANRFRASRNPYYTSALRDAEDALKTMQIDNNSGNWANPWTMSDTAGTVWGGDVGGGSFFGN